MTFTPSENAAIARAAQYLACLRAVEGADLNSLCLDVSVHSKSCPVLMAVSMEGSDIILQFLDCEKTLSGKDQLPTPVAVKSAIDEYIRDKKADAYIATLIDSIASKDGVFIESISIQDLQLLQAIWSDAYGEDKLELYGFTVKKDTWRGYVRSSMSKEQIAVMNNDDGPELKNTKPLFEGVVPVCHIL